MSEFNEVSSRYDEELRKGISLAGEEKDFFIENRLKIVKSKISSLSSNDATIVDFGCGTGSSIFELKKQFSAKLVLGIDTSDDSLELAKKQHVESSFYTSLQKLPKLESCADLVYTNGTFHHIPPSERPSIIGDIFKSLKPGGMLAFWENNPWSLAARFVMHRIPFDKDAKMVWPHQMRNNLRTLGFEVIETSYWFVFPSFLRALRGAEPWLSSMPLGAQYFILAKKPNNNVEKIT